MTKISVPLHINGGFTGYTDRLDKLRTAIRVLKADHLNQLLEDEVFEFTSSSIYNNKINSFAWGLWHDPDTEQRGPVKNRDKALSGYERAQELLSANPFPANQLESKIYGIRKRDVPNYINTRIAALRRGEGREGENRGREDRERNDRERRGN
ncbi:hypothetical protein [Xenorhabdus innexi]|uniref:Uncharacterized protein n=1 Tax=Xenorhabdus innexi TaxID=290109 RepID=A0A1N6MWZ0_9GAMM|nr:hypothetical protein [Xenorhabdus innexi]PHM28758.1 hypothetical protein Xinn_03793 [Xenorhabdus innexi]SIP73350.1 hypothetical protein XIS1_1820003 [Xenorhabdus innexi]